MSMLKKNTIKKRRGIIRIHREMMYDYLDILPKAFAHFVPFHIDDNPWDASIKYSGFSELFDEIPEGTCSELPEYDAVFQTIDGEECFLKFDRIR